MFSGKVCTASLHKSSSSMCQTCWRAYCMPFLCNILLEFHHLALGEKVTFQSLELLLSSIDLAEDSGLTKLLRIRRNLLQKSIPRYMQVIPDFRNVTSFKKNKYRILGTKWKKWGTHYTHACTHMHSTHTSEIIHSDTRYKMETLHTCIYTYAYIHIPQSCIHTQVWTHKIMLQS